MPGVNLPTRRQYFSSSVNSNSFAEMQVDSPLFAMSAPSGKVPAKKRRVMIVKDEGVELTTPELELAPFLIRDVGEGMATGSAQNTEEGEIGDDGNEGRNQFEIARCLCFDIYELIFQGMSRRSIKAQPLSAFPMAESSVRDAPLF
jgi:hypothetical protein